MDSVVGSEVITEDGFKLYFHPAAKKKYNVTVVFVHHMWGNNKTTWRHYQYLNDKGFDCVSFDLLMGSDRKKIKYHPLLKFLYKGVFYVWTKQIRSVLDNVEGDKIVYGFSGPSLSAIWASEGRSDIKKVICDGGPFHHIYENSKNFFYHELGIKNKKLNALCAFFGKVIWGHKPLKKLHKVLRHWPKAVPILSIRGAQDNIVALKSIQSVFSSHNNVKLEVLELKYGKHLDGMRDFPEEYCKVLLPFIKQQLNKLV